MSKKKFWLSVIEAFGAAILCALLTWLNAAISDGVVHLQNQMPAVIRVVVYICNTIAYAFLAYVMYIENVNKVTMGFYGALAILTIAGSCGVPIAYGFSLIAGSSLWTMLTLICLFVVPYDLFKNVWPKIQAREAQTTVIGSCSQKFSLPKLKMPRNDLLK